MVTKKISLPISAADLQETILKLQNENEKLLIEKMQLESRIEFLHFQLMKTLKKQYGSSSEKMPGQLELAIFDEATTDNQALVEQADEEITIASYGRKKPGRQPLPTELPREQIIYDLTDEQKICHCNNALHKIGEDKYEQLEYVPAKIKVIEHVRIKYSCRKCQEGVKTATIPGQPIPKSIATPGLLAYVVSSKFEDHLPLYRQEQIWQRIGVDIPRATLCNWVLKCGELVSPLCEKLKSSILSAQYIQADETPVQVLNEEGKSSTSKSYMWIYGAGPPSKPMIIYEYHPTRSGQVASEFLKDYKGYLQTDGYGGYNALRCKKDVTVFACWAHGRRRFVDIVKVTKDTGRAQTALNYINKLYDIEKRARENKLDADAIFNIRQEKSKPILLRFKPWLDEHIERIPPKSPLGQAIGYLLNHWEALNIYLTNGNLMIDNNYIENKIRPFALGRRNWLFMGNARGAHAAANLISLIESAKANNLEAYYYLRYIFKQLPTSESEEQLITLLPHKCDPVEILKI